MKTGQLDQNLRRFYAEVGTKKGEDYSKSTLLGFRHSIERFLNAPPFSRGIQISSDPRFARSNFMLDAQIKNLKRSGKENVFDIALQCGKLEHLKGAVSRGFCSFWSILRENH